MDARAWTILVLSVLIVAMIVGRLITLRREIVVDEEDD